MQDEKNIVAETDGMVLEVSEWRLKRAIDRAGQDVKAYIDDVCTPDAAPKVFAAWEKDFHSRIDTELGDRLDAEFGTGNVFHDRGGIYARGDQRDVYKRVCCILAVMHFFGLEYAMTEIIDKYEDSAK